MRDFIGEFYPGRIPKW